MEHSSNKQSRHSSKLNDNDAPKNQQHSYTFIDILGSPLSESQALSSILADAEASRIFFSFPLKEQQRLLSFMKGAQGLKITYDSFFKHIMNPDVHPSRLEHFLSAILNQEIKICSVLPLEGVRIANAGSFVIMDIVAVLSDGSIVNVEIQKTGYLFPGERASCYIADLIMRQYNRVKDMRGKHFSFRDLKPVILIIIMEESPPPFQAVFPNYIHREIISYDSCAIVNHLFQTIYISLDTFHSVVHNINTKLDAWLTFLSSDNPADIIRLVNTFPAFLSCYHDIMEFRKNPKELIFMYSEALAILDRNTEIYMNDLLRNEIEKLKTEISTKNTILSQKDAALSEQNAILSQKDAALLQKDTALLQKDTALSEQNAILSQKEKEIALLRNQLNELLSKQ